MVSDPIPGHESYEGWIAIPYLRRGAQPVSMRFRNPVQGATPKYLSMPDEPVRLYNVRALDYAEDEIHVTEGEFDAIVLEKCGLPAVAVPGVQSWRSHFKRLLAGFSRVWIWGDGDEAGADFTRKLTHAMRSAKGVRMPRGMDITDLYVGSGLDAVLSLVEDLND